MTTTMTCQLQKAALSYARSLLEQTVPVLRCHPGLKRPYANSEGTWDVCDDPDRVEGWLKPGDNLAVLLGPEKASPVIAVGLDVYKDPEIIDFAKELGVTSDAPVWIQRTGRGGLTPIYSAPSISLKRNTREKGSAIDLLTNGYTLIPPSDTGREPDGGGPYTWIKGHSPLDIPLGDLDEPPKDLLVWWQGLSAPELPHAARDSGRSQAPSWLTDPIPEGQRNETLAKLAGYYHRKLSDDAVVSHLVHQANLTQCHPPLPRHEVDTIVNSILRREGAGHYRGVTPATLEYIR